MGRGSKGRKIRISKERLANAFERFSESARCRPFLSLAHKTDQDGMNLVHHALHGLKKGVVFRGVDDKTRAVTGDRQEVGMDFTANSGGDFAPGFRAKKVTPDGNRFTLTSIPSSSREEAEAGRMIISPKIGPNSVPSRKGIRWPEKLLGVTGFWLRNTAK